jgi:hypothetical protein
MNISNSSISKTAFLKYDQCAKAFFIYKKHPYLRDPVSKEKQFTFNRGHAVGNLAQQLFPGGIDVSLQTKNSKAAFELTQQLLKENVTTIYEATFIFNDILVMVDILHFDGENWTAYEVKSSLKVSDAYIKDACLQYYVLKNSLNNFDDLFLVTLNSNYVLEDEINLKQLFKKRSIKINAEENIEFFSQTITQMNLVLERNVIPDIPIGKQCFSPYECDYVGTCWKNTKDPKSVFKIGKSDREQLFTLYFSGADTVDKIDLNSDLKPHLKIQAKSIKTGEPYFEKEEIDQFLKKVRGNYCFLDMEIWSPAIPKYNGTSPFEQIPFLFSVCYLANGIPTFKNYLKPIESDSRRQFLISLLEATKDFDTVLVFDKNLEQQILSKLENLYPEYKTEVDLLRKKMIDLSEPIQKFNFYHPKFNGNFSLKAVSEIFDTSSDYAQLEIGSGIVAMHKYEGLLIEENEIIAEETKDQLISYCNIDTLTCLKFFDYLKARVKE